MTLPWLPMHERWDDELHRLRNLPAAEAAPQLVQLAQYSIDFVQTLKLDRAIQACKEQLSSLFDPAHTVKIAIEGSSTLTHLVAGIRIGAIRRGMYASIYEGPFGQYRQELSFATSGLHEFKPDFLLLSLDARHLLSSESSSVDGILNSLVSYWKIAKDQLGASVIQQTLLPVFSPLLGNNEHTYGASAYMKVQELNQALRLNSTQHGVHLLSVDSLSAIDGITAWTDQALWFRSKQEIHPRVSPLYGDHVARIAAAVRGISSKCLVLDLDNTLWGGVIGDDGVEGIILGQGNAVGEAFLSFQHYVKQLAARGVILAVCSKNDMSNALLPFQRLSEMVLQEGDISCFIANWDDKPTNLRRIASTLNISLDSLVFVDDNPFERELVRTALPMVAVPEMSDDPAYYETILASGGYFESINVTTDDAARVIQYAENANRAKLKSESTDLASYLQSLSMQLLWAPFDEMNLTRITQLINKSNQFNLTTKRYTQDEIRALTHDPSVLTLRLRLIDSFGDNGTIAVVIAKIDDALALEIDTWLMSCRVLGRQIEETTLNLIVDMALGRDIKRIKGTYVATAKNSLVKDLYPRLGFKPADAPETDRTSWSLATDEYLPSKTFARIISSDPQVEGSYEQGSSLRTTY